MNFNGDVHHTAYSAQCNRCGERESLNANGFCASCWGRRPTGEVKDCPRCGSERHRSRHFYVHCGSCGLQVDADGE